MSDEIYNIKEKITDSEFMSIMDKLSNLHKKYKRTFDEVDDDEEYEDDEEEDEEAEDDEEEDEEAEEEAEEEDEEAETSPQDQNPGETQSTQTENTTQSVNDANLNAIMCTCNGSTFCGENMIKLRNCRFFGRTLLYFPLLNDLYLKKAHNPILIQLTPLNRHIYYNKVQVINLNLNISKLFNMYKNVEMNKKIIIFMAIMDHIFRFFGFIDQLPSLHTIIKQLLIKSKQIKPNVIKNIINYYKLSENPFDSWLVNIDIPISETDISSKQQMKIIMIAGEASE